MPLRGRNLHWHLHDIVIWRGVAPRACVRVYARVLVSPNLYIHT